jgi:hypothetical protein
MPFNPFSALTAKLFGGLSLALLIGCAVLWFRLGHVERDRDAWKSAHEAQRQATIATAAASKAKAIAARAQAERHYSDLAERSDHDLASLRAQVGRAAARYVAANRLRPEGAGPAPGGPAAPAEGGGPEGPDGPGAGAELVAIPQRDFDILVDNTVRLLVAHQWAKTLAEPVPEVEFGQ